MLERTNTYITKCVDLGILSSSSFRKYPLRPLNLAIVLKAYALTTGLPYDLNNSKLQEIAHHKYYLTDSGLEWLYSVLSSWSLMFLRSVFPLVFSKATEEDLKSLDKYRGLANFRGTVGLRPKAGSKQEAMLVRLNGKRKIKYKFKSLREARAELLSLSRYYPLENFKLYRRMTNGYFAEVPLVINTTRGGSINNLPEEYR